MSHRFTPTFTPPGSSSRSFNWLSSTATNTSKQSKMIASAARAISTSNKLPSRKHYKNTVTIVVGPEKEPYTLHKELLCFYSDFFRAAFQGSFKEATEGRIELLDVQHESSTADPSLPRHTTLANLWVFGDQYQIPLLQNCAIDAIIKKTELSKTFYIGIVKIAYQNTLENSRLRKLAIEICVFDMTHIGHEQSIFGDDQMDNWSKEALVDFARAISKAWEDESPWRTLPVHDKCFYHVHSEGEHC
ncbi:hypothetical protein AUEXF2481DRAFT_24501 [Aureobasidium subglaciale EXF-2481]|uniref:BTB domain-containing protein n=1 Tax=Aureobasidium subglaciale (strain EXF-2481) TaxID=1043005 RepID=A0A074Z1G4_AURSE|nr:uncharacterized protein AUEXF2481DRAFT_24501 [Aureobasidium subglaciale EXF-2481]KER00148.1 hypothetical protein AUEXF2481DRAFT_24501 [Aureobasidium subglaciale EXF-2481]